MKKVTAFIIMATGVTLASAPAFAGQTVPLPEPSALSIIAGTAVALLIVNRFIRRK